MLVTTALRSTKGISLYIFTTFLKLLDFQRNKHWNSKEKVVFIIMITDRRVSLDLMLLFGQWKKVTLVGEGDGCHLLDYGRNHQRWDRWLWSYHHTVSGAPGFQLGGQPQTLQEESHDHLPFHKQQQLLHLWEVCV